MQNTGLQAKNDLRDKIDSWNDMIKYCTKFSDLVVSAEKTAIIIFRLNGVPPDVEFSIYIYKDFHVDAYRSKKKILVRDPINGFSNALAKCSQIDLIARLNDTPKDIQSEIRFMGNNLMSLCDGDNEKRQRIGKQLISLDAGLHGRRYSGESMTAAINLYLQSRSTYRALRELLVLPCRNTIYEYFGKLGLAGSLAE